MGEMRFTLALSGWTANDWSGASALDQHFGGFQARDTTVDRLANHLESVRSATLGAAPCDRERGREDRPRQPPPAREARPARVRLRERRVPLAADPRCRAVRRDARPRARGGRRGQAARWHGRRSSARSASGAKQLVVAKVKNTSCEAMFDLDAVITRAKCTCSFFHECACAAARAGTCSRCASTSLAANPSRAAADGARDRPSVSLIPVCSCDSNLARRPERTSPSCCGVPPWRNCSAMHTHARYSLGTG